MSPASRRSPIERVTDASLGFAERTHFADIGKHNVIVRKDDNRMIVIDFEIDEDHPHWKPRKPLYDHIAHFK